MDLLFPHHECELAQNTASRGTGGVKYWMHNNLITVNGQKMSKSYGNTIPIFGPEKAIEKIVEGRLEKFYAEVCLLEQKFVKNPDLSIQDILNGLISTLGENISVKRFVRFQVGA